VSASAALPTIISFGRSGGTLVNQLLGTHPDCLVLSEVNPAASFKPVSEQAVEWLGLLAADEVNGFDLLPYGQQIRTLVERARARSKRLVVRDWTSVNFVAGSTPYAHPSRRLEQVVYLQRAALDPLPLAIVRRSEAVFVSWRRSFAQFAELSADAFIDAYLDYAALVREYPIVRLEQIQADPNGEARRILERFDLDATPLDMILAEFHRFARCTGNNTLVEAAESAAAGRILPPPPRGESMLAGKAAKKFALADEWLGYD